MSMKWLGSFAGVIRMENLFSNNRDDLIFEAKAVPGQLSFMKGAANGQMQVWVKLPFGKGKAAWKFYMGEPAATAAGLKHGDIVPITKDGHAVKPGQKHPETGEIFDPKAAKAKAGAAQQTAPKQQAPAAPPAAPVHAPPAAPAHAAPVAAPAPAPAPAHAPAQAPVAAPAAPAQAPAVAAKPEPDKNAPDAKETEPDKQVAKETDPKQTDPKTADGSVEKAIPDAGKEDPKPDDNTGSSEEIKDPKMLKLYHELASKFGYENDKNKALALKHLMIHGDAGKAAFELSKAIGSTPTEASKHVVSVALDIMGAKDDLKGVATFSGEDGSAKFTPKDDQKDIAIKVSPEAQKVFDVLSKYPGFTTDADIQNKFLKDPLFAKGMLLNFGSGWLEKFKEAGGTVFGASAKKPQDKATAPAQAAPAPAVTPKAAPVGPAQEVASWKKKLSDDDYHSISDDMSDMGIAVGSIAGKALYAIIAAKYSGVDSPSPEVIGYVSGLDAYDVEWAIKKLHKVGLTGSNGVLSQHVIDNVEVLKPKSAVASVQASGGQVITPEIFDSKAAELMPDVDEGSVIHKILSSAAMLGGNEFNVTVPSVAKYMLDNDLVVHVAGDKYAFSKKWFEKGASKTVAPAAPAAHVAAPAAAPAAAPPSAAAPAQAEPEKEKKGKKGKKKSEPAPSLLGGSIASIPDESELEHVQNASHLGGAGEKHLYKAKGDSSGQQWLFKVAKAKSGGDEKPYAAHVQQSFSTVASIVKPGHIEIKTANLDGKFGTLQPFFEGAKNLEHNGQQSNGVPPKSLTPLEMEDVAAEHMLDWAMSQHDTYPGNLLRTKSGRIIGVDKEQAFKFIGTDKLDLDWKTENPIQPYYTQFWKSWVTGEFDFDPKKLKPYIDRLDAISDDDYKASMQPYVEAMWDGKPKKQNELMAQILERKKTTRASFENFFTGLYKKRTGANDGAFTFAAGWVPAGGSKAAKKDDDDANQVAPAPVVPPPAPKMKKYNASDFLSTYPGLDFKGSYLPKGGSVPDPTKVGIRCKGDTGKLIEFAKKMGLKPWVPPEANADGVVNGATYNWMFFHKSDWDKAEVEAPEVVSVSTYTPPPAPKKKKPSEFKKPEYMPAFKGDYQNAHSNLHEVSVVEHLVTGPTGKYFMSDGTWVENGHFRARKYIDSKGKPYYMFHMKLRPHVWEKYANKGVAAKFGFHHGQYDEHKDAVILTNQTDHIVETRKWTSGKSEIHVCTSDKMYTYMGGVYTKIYVDDGESPLESFKALLKEVDPELEKKVLTPPTEEELEIQKLSRLLWATHPQTADSLPESKRTVSHLKSILSKNGVSQERIDSMQLKEVYPGFLSWVEPGRWKKMAGGKVKFLTEGPRSIDQIPDVLSSAFMGGHERDLFGHGKSEIGASVEDDTNNGSADGILTCAVTENTLDHDTLHSTNSYVSAAGVAFVFTPDVLDRLDAYAHIGDCWGAASPLSKHKHNHAWTNRNTVESVVENISKHHKHHEISFRKGLPLSKLARIVCHSGSGYGDNADNNRAKVIALCKQRGIHQVNGVPIEDFVVAVEGGNCGTVYENYIKPLGY